MQRQEGRSIVLSILDLGPRRGLVVHATQRLIYPQEKLGTTCTEDGGGMRVHSGRVWKISFPPEFERRNFQPRASRYTVYFKLATKFPVLEQKL